MCPGVRESEPGAALVGDEKIRFATGPSRALSGSRNSSCWLLVLHSSSVVAGGRQGHAKSASRVLLVPVLALRSEVNPSLPLRGTHAHLTFAVQLVARPRDPNPEQAQQPRSILGCGHSLPGCLT